MGGMYLGIAHHFGWAVAVTASGDHEVVDRRRIDIHLYDAKRVEDEAVRILGERAADVLQGPRAKLGPPWSRDHRTALAATVFAASSRGVIA